MYGVPVERASYEAIVGLTHYIDVLESALRDARDARDLLLQGVAPAGEEGPGGVRVAIAPDSRYEGGLSARGSGTSLSSNPTAPAGDVSSSPRAGSEPIRGFGQPATAGYSPGSYSQSENALVNAGVTRRTAILEMIRVIAAANDGLVVIQEANAVLRKLDLTKSSATNLSGYLIKKMMRSNEFERVDELGRGVYRWLHIREAATEANQTDCPSEGGDMAPMGLPEDEEKSTL